MPTETIYPSGSEHHEPEEHHSEPENHEPAPAPEPVAMPPESESVMPTEHFFGGAMPLPPQVAEEKTALPASGSDQPVAVVQALSVRGVEYTMMTLCLWFAAGSFIWLLLSLLNGGGSYDNLSFPVSVLIVSVPIFAFLFLRLRKDELANPSLRLDPSKRRLSQFTQIFAFSACFFDVIGLIYEIMQKMAGHFSGSIGKVVIDSFIIFLIAGGVLVYYWIDEHRLARSR